MPDGVRLGILEGSTFCICDERGDIDFETGGLFAEDTRFLSLLRLTVNGQRPLILSSDKVEYFSAAFYMRNPLADGLKQDQLSIARTRFIGEGMQATRCTRSRCLRSSPATMTPTTGSSCSRTAATATWRGRRSCSRRRASRTARP
jgi:N-terminal domain of (some) glycogen debranching enzymes